MVIISKPASRWSYNFPYILLICGLVVKIYYIVIFMIHWLFIAIWMWKMAFLGKNMHFLAYFIFEVHFHQFNEDGLSLSLLSMKDSVTGQFLGKYQNPYCFLFWVIAQKAWYYCPKCTKIWLFYMEIWENNNLRAFCK